MAQLGQIVPPAPLGAVISPRGNKCYHKIKIELRATDEDVQAYGYQKQGITAKFSFMTPSAIEYTVRGKVTVSCECKWEHVGLWGLTEFKLPVCKRTTNAAEGSHGSTWNDVVEWSDRNFIYEKYVETEGCCPPTTDCVCAGPEYVVPLHHVWTVTAEQSVDDDGNPVPPSLNGDPNQWYQWWERHNDDWSKGHAHGLECPTGLLGPLGGLFSTATYFSDVHKHAIKRKLDEVAGLVEPLGPKCDENKPAIEERPKPPSTGGGGGGPELECECVYTGQTPSYKYLGDGCTQYTRRYHYACKKKDPKNPASGDPFMPEFLLLSNDPNNTIKSRGTGTSANPCRPINFPPREPFCDGECPDKWIVWNNCVT